MVTWLIKCARKVLDGNEKKFSNGVMYELSRRKYNKLLSVRLRSVLKST